jgi:hypothetical protein
MKGILNTHTLLVFEEPIPAGPPAAHPVADDRDQPLT